MTDIESTAASPDGDEDDAPSIFDLPGDWFLRTIVETIVSNGVDIGVTLSAGGSVISGVAISGEKYFDLFADQMTVGSKSDDIKNVIGEGWRAYKQIYAKPDDAGDDWVRPRTGYIHLKDARFFAPGQRGLPTGKGILWRGRLESVDGFSLGNFQEG